MASENNRFLLFYTLENKLITYWHFTYSVKTANDSNPAHMTQYKIIDCASECSTKVTFIFSMEVGTMHRTSFYPLMMKRTDPGARFPGSSPIVPGTSCVTWTNS